MPTPNNIDTSATGLALAEEVVGSPGYLPGDANPAGGNFAGTAKWYGREPNSYKDFGADFKQTPRNPIVSDRQQLKGAVTDLDVSAGWNEDLTMNNMLRVMRGVFMAAMREKPDTLGVDTTNVAVTGVTGATGVILYGAGPVFIVKHLVQTSGFTNAANNGVFAATAAGAGTVTFGAGAGMVDEGAPPATARLQAVGAQFAAGDVGITYAAPVCKLTSTVFDFTTLGLAVGEWIFIGDDVAGNTFATAGLAGYARISVIAVHAITFDKTTFTPVADAGAAKTIRIYFGKLLRNEAAGSIVVRSFQAERQLGNDGNGVQSEYAKGILFDQMDFNSPKADKVQIDFTGVGMDYETRTGTLGIKAGTRVAALGENAIDTSNGLYRARIAAVDPTTMNPTPYFAYVSDFKVSINNNTKINKAQSILGGFSVTLGNLVTKATITAYFTTVGGIAAMKANADVTFDAIYSAGNKGIVLDLPLVSIAGKVNPVKDEPVMIALDTPAYKAVGGYTAQVNFFAYLPNIAM